MKVICSYCRKDMQEKEPFHDTRISHSVCPECYEYFKEQWDGMSLDRYLDKFDAPIMIMDANCRIIAANKMAVDLTGKKYREVVGLLGGEAMECVYSRLPEGCGKTVHCETCTIRNTINKAFATGKSQVRVPVRIKQEHGEVTMKISTVKFGELLRVIIEN